MAVVILRFWVRTRHGLTWVFGLTKGHFNKLDVERLTGRENSPSLKNVSVGLKSIKDFRCSLNVKNKQTIKNSRDDRPLYVDKFPSTVNINTFPREIDSHLWSIAFTIVFRNTLIILFFLILQLNPWMTSNPLVVSLHRPPQRNAATQPTRPLIWTGAKHLDMCSENLHPGKQPSFSNISFHVLRAQPADTYASTPTHLSRVL